MESGEKIRWTNRWRDGQMDGWEPLFFIAAVVFWSRIRLRAVNASLCHIWTVVSTSNHMMNRTEGGQRKDGGWISPRRSASCSYRQINICRHSSAIDSIHVWGGGTNGSHCKGDVSPALTTHTLSLRQRVQKYVLFAFSRPLWPCPPNILWARDKRSGKG